MSKKTREKELNELTKYEWQSAVCFSKELNAKPTVIAIGNALMNFATGDTESGIFAYLGQRTLAERIGVSSAKQVQRQLKVLEETGAITRVNIPDLTPEQRKEMNRRLNAERSNRGTVYKLNMMWAKEAWEFHSRQTNKPRTEPVALKTARLSKVSDRDRRTHSVPYKRTHSVPHNGDALSTPNTLGRYFTDTNSGSEDKNIEVSDRGTVSDEPTRLPVGSELPSHDLMKELLSDKMRAKGFKKPDINATIFLAERENWGPAEIDEALANMRKEASFVKQLDIF